MQPPPSGSRPADNGRLLVFLWAIVATAHAGPELLWRPWPHVLLADSTASPTALAVYKGITALPAWLLPLLAYPSDRVAIRGSRREGYLVLAGFLAAVTWTAAPFVPRAYGPWLGIGLTLATAAAFFNVAINGGLAEIAQRRRASGRLSAAAQGLGAAGALAAFPVIEFLSGKDLGWTAGIGATVATSIAVIALLSPRETPAATAEPIPRPPPRLSQWLRSRLFWAGVLVLAGRAFSYVANLALEQYERLHLEAAETLQFRADVGWSVAAIVAAAVYYLTCTRMPLRKLLPLAQLLEAASLLTLLGVQSTAGGVILARTAFGLGGTFAACARWDLVLRLAPPGREASGVALLFAASQLITVIVSAFAMATGDPFRTASPSFVATAVACTALWATATLAVPRSVTAARDHRSRYG